MLIEVSEDHVAALADLCATVRPPGAWLLHQAQLLGRVDELAELVDSGAVEDLEVRLAERRGKLALDDLDLALAADHVVPALDGLLAPDVEADRAAELARVAAGGRLGVAVDHADLLAQLVTGCSTERSCGYAWLRDASGRS